jgi:hypothetical protein
VNYEEDPGSGAQMVPIDLKVSSYNGEKLNGLRMQAAGWHFALQTEDDVKSQRPKGTIGFGGKQGKHYINQRLASIGYLHWPTKALTEIDGPADYSAAPEINESMGNVTENIDVPDEIVCVANSIKWRDIWTTPNGGEIFIHWKLQGDRLKEDVVVNKAAREWIAANSPAITAEDETWFGFKFEIDGNGLGRIYRGKQRRSFNDDTDDDHRGGFQFKNNADEFIAFMPSDDVYVGRRGGRRPLRKRIYKESGKNYLFVGVRLDHLAALLPGDLVFDPTYQEDISERANDCYQYTYDGVEYAAQITALAVGFQSVEYAPVTQSQYTGGWRFTPDIPAGASVTSPGAYARLAQYGQYTDSLYNPELLTGHVKADIKSSNQPVFAEDFADSPNPGTNWTDGAADTLVNWTNNDEPGLYNALPPIDVSAQVQEVIDLPGWAPGNGLRLRCYSNELVAQTAWMWGTGWDSAGPKAYLVARWVTDESTLSVQRQEITVIGIGL